MFVVKVNIYVTTENPYNMPSGEYKSNTCIYPIQNIHNYMLSTPIMNFGSMIVHTRS